jgi:DNA repair photolyase
VLPGITDAEHDLRQVARLARDAGAQWLAASILFLMPSSKKEFMPFLDKEFPKLSRRYREFYQGSGYSPQSYRHEIAQRIRELRREYGLAAGPPVSVEKQKTTSQQLSLKLCRASA